MQPPAQVQVIDNRLDELDAMPVTSDAAARGALKHAMVTVGQINQVSTQARAQALIGAGGPVDDLLAKLSDWLDRLVTAVSVTVNFGPFGAVPA